MINLICNHVISLFSFSGAYIGTLGQIWSNNPVIVKATKVMYLSDQRICKSVWRDEVTLSKAFLAGLILPSLS